MKDLESEGYGRRNGDTYFKTHPILCNYTQFDCDYLNAQNSEGRQYCPNCYGDARESKIFSCPCQPGEGSFLCKESNTCIPDGMSLFLSTSIYILVLIYVCHFHHHFLLQLPLVKFDHYRDTRASILDPCIQGIFYQKFSAFCMIHFNCMTHFRTNNFQQRNCF